MKRRSEAISISIRNIIKRPIKAFNDVKQIHEKKTYIEPIVSDTARRARQLCRERNDIRECASANQ